MVSWFFDQDIKKINGEGIVFVPLNFVLFLTNTAGILNIHMQNNKVGLLP